ncbi:MAG TPA: Uma2 family endonuclease [Blastocatellia bacterium]|nr:Uma2 family endonuclease [Blastocatellia bacterium]
MVSQPKRRYTEEEYLALERSSEAKHEYFNGEIFAMGGASRQHVLIVTNVVGELHLQLKRGPCRVFSTDLRVKVDPAGLYTYPDVVVLCDAARFSDEQEDTLLNPALIIEVLSESTKDYDRGGKFEQYRAIDSFVEYLLVAQDRPHVEHYVRQPDRSWTLYETNNLEDIVQLTSVRCSLRPADIYDKIEFRGTPSPSLDHSSGIE